MRLLLVGLLAVLASASLAGCLQRTGVLTIHVEVSDQGAIREFRVINFTLEKVRIDARTQNPEDVPSSVTTLELVNAASRGPQAIFRQEVRADQYTKVTLLPGRDPPTFEGVLLDGTRVALVATTLFATTSFEVPRGGSLGFTMVLEVTRNPTGTGSPTYILSVDPEASGVR